MPEAIPPPPPPHAAGSATGSGDTDEHIVERRSLRDYYIILRERLWIALPLALLVAVSIGYYQSRETPMYRTSATMQFVTKAQKVVMNASVQETTVQSDVDFNNYISLLRSGQIRDKVVASLTDPNDLKKLQRPYLKDLAPGQAPPSAAAATPGWDVTPQKGSTFITITVSHRDPEAAALIANRVIDQFTKYLESNKTGYDDQAIKLLSANVQKAQRDADEAQKQLTDFVRTHNLGSSLASAISLAESKRNTAQAEVDAANAQIRAIQAPLSQIEQFRREKRDLLQIAEIKNDVDVAKARDALAAATTQWELLSEKYLARHPRMIAATDQLDTAQKALENAVTHAEAVLKSRLAQANATLEQASARSIQAAKEVADLGPLNVEYSKLQATLEVARTTYNELLKRQQDVTVVQSTEQTPVKVVDLAGVPGSPYSPDLNRITRTCIGIGILVFVGVAIGLSFIDDRIKSAWDVEHYIGVNLLGIIPDLSTLKDEEKYTMVLNNRQTPGSESFLSVYSAVKIHSKLDFPKSILITSTIPGEGKTLISSNLAGSFARHGKRTLLIDCDLRRPMMHRHFKQQNNNGLITWFENGANVEGNLPEDPTLGIIKVGDGLSLLCSGGRSKSPTEILESKAFGDLLSRLKRFYDLVIVDSPPLGAVTDSLLIAQRTDEVIYVCRFNRAYKKHIRLYVKALRSGRNEVLGVVLNGLTPRRIEYYSNYRYYRSYKKYYGSQT
jgi:succinoglycan biosynthesis transport protein ExoP